jgi:hypothetical protein
MPAKLHKFVKSILEKHLKISDTAEDPDLNRLRLKVSKFETSNRKLRKYLLTKLNERQLFLFINALHNQSMKSADEFVQLTQTQTSKVVEHEQPDQTLTDECCPVHEEHNELEFTSDYSIFSYDEEENESCGELAEKKSAHSSPSKSLDSKLSMNPKVVLDKLDLAKYNLNVKKVVSIESTIDQTPSHSNTEAPAQHTSYRGNPSRKTISKLNLFRNFLNDDQDMNEFNRVSSMNSNSTDEFSMKKELFNTNANRSIREMCISDRVAATATPQKSKFYKLNDLVSIMINEDYFNECEMTSSSASRTCDSSAFVAPEKMPPPPLPAALQTSTPIKK